MIVENFKITYFCTKCEKSLKVSNMNVEFNIDDVHKHIGRTQCVNCKRIETVDPAHIECVLSTKTLFNYQYTLRCNLCNTLWVTKCIIGGKLGPMQMKRRMEEESKCINPSCASRNFSLIAYKKLDN